MLPPLLPWPPLSQPPGSAGRVGAGGAGPGGGRTAAPGEGPTAEPSLPCAVAAAAGRPTLSRGPRGSCGGAEGAPEDDRERTCLLESLSRPLPPRLHSPGKPRWPPEPWSALAGKGDGEMGDATGDVIGGEGWGEEGGHRVWESVTAMKKRVCQSEGGEAGCLACQSCARGLVEAAGRWGCAPAPLSAPFLP